MYFLPYYCKMQRKPLLLIFLFLTLINIIVFFFRSHFQYQPYTNYASLYAPCYENCERKWKEYIYDFPPRELEEAKKITDSLVVPSSGSFQKVLKIGSFLYERFSGKLGTPSADLLASTPMAQYKKLCSGDTVKLWCNNLALMFSYFCWSQNIICRNIEISNPGDHHVLNECYLPESRQWIVVDLTHNLLAVEKDSATNTFYNLLDFRTALRNKNSLQAYRSTANGIIKSTIYSNESFARYYKSIYPVFFYHWVNYFKVYARGHKIKEYLLPLSWYDFYDNGKSGNLAFYLKQLLILLWLVSFFVFLFSRTKFKT